MFQKQGAKTLAHIACPGMFRPEPNTADLLVGELESPRNGPDLLNETDDAIVMQTGSRLAQPVARPKQDIVG